MPGIGTRLIMRRWLLLPVLLIATGAVAFPIFPDSTLDVTQIVSSQPESLGIYVGSPSLITLPSGDLLASHDFFGPGAGNLIGITRTFISRGGGPFVASGNATGLYWATLFTRANDTGVYLLGTSGDERSKGQITIARSGDDGATWATSVLVTDAKPFSTGPTPVLLSGGRLWRAFEHNIGAWGSGYASVVISADANAPDLSDPNAWTRSGELSFASVLHLVPSNWSDAPAPYTVTPNYGWLEGNAVERDDGQAGIFIVLRVNSPPAANKAALLELAGAAATPVFIKWIEPFYGGNSKFSIKRDPASGLYVALVSAVVEPAAVTLPPSCGPVSLRMIGNRSAPLPCCGFLEACNAEPTNATCVWCHANSRNQLSLAVAKGVGGPWSLAAEILYDDTGLPQFLSEMNTGFQYADFIFVEGDIVASVRSGYRGSNNFHNSNRHLLKVISNWTRYVG